MLCNKWKKMCPRITDLSNSTNRPHTQTDTAVHMQPIFFRGGWKDAQQKKIRIYDSITDHENTQNAGNALLTAHLWMAGARVHLLTSFHSPSGQCIAEPQTLHNWLCERLTASYIWRSVPSAYCSHCTIWQQHQLSEITTSFTTKILKYTHEQRSQHIINPSSCWNPQIHRVTLPSQLSSGPPSDVSTVVLHDTSLISSTSNGGGDGGHGSAYVWSFTTQWKCHTSTCAILVQHW